MTETERDQQSWQFLLKMYDYPPHILRGILRDMLEAAEHRGYRDGIKDALEAIAQVRERSREAVSS